MGKNKLKKFADMERFECVLQYPREELIKNGFPYRGEWNGALFKESRPLVLELGCGRGEYTELWITFPDPQMQKVRKRLTSTRFLNLYRRLLKPGGLVNLKTDSPFLYEYTRRLVRLNGFEVLTDCDDIYGKGLADPERSIKTYYEQQWLGRGKQIKLLQFGLPAEGDLQEPEADDIPKDDYRSTKGRSVINE